MAALDWAIFGYHFFIQIDQQNNRIFHIDSFQSRGCSFKPTITLSLKSYFGDSKSGAAKALLTKAKIRKYIIRQNTRLISL